MRIVGGRWKGRALAPVGKGDEAARLRPTSDRVRESLFNHLEHGSYPSLEDAVVLDLFAGTGALGLEALSRGAAHAVFVEKGRVALSILQRNLDLLDAHDMTSVLKDDAVKLRTRTGEIAQFVFADPPYGRGLCEAALIAASANGWLAEGAVAVLEDNTAVDAPPGFVQEDVRQYGDTTITVLTRIVG